MGLRIALAGNPNSGKTTLFNALTGSNQFVGNWPGVTVEKKEGRLKKDNEITVTDLPGIYSLSPYSPEEVVARNYLLGERPDAILNIVDGTNIERNLYLTTQLTEIGIPVVVAVNMMDVVKKNGDNIDIEKLSMLIGCKVVEISALKGTGIDEAAEAAVEAAKSGTTEPLHIFSGEVEHTLAHIEEAAIHSMDAEKQRWYAIKIFERDEKVIEELKIPQNTLEHIEKDITACEKLFDDNAESIITNERYDYVTKITAKCCTKKNKGGLSTSDKIDRVLTNRFLALPIFAVIMFVVYYISVTTVGTIVTDWANDGVFGDGWHLFGIGTSQYEEEMNEYAAQNIFTEDVVLTIDKAVNAGIIGADELQAAVADGDFGAFDEAYASYADTLITGGFDISETVDLALEAENVPDTSEYGIWVPGVPVLVEKALISLNTPEWLNSLLLDGIIGGVGAVLGFVPQLMVLFIFLAFLEACGYMSRIAFVLDKIFCKFGLSGKSFIPMLVGIGCGVPGIMASRTIENQRDRRMTIITTTFMPCGAKLPIIALIATSLFGGAWWVGPSAYFIGIAAIVITGLILKKTKPFAGDPAPFVLELPAYHMPTLKNILLSMWERSSSFVKKAGTVILLASMIIWSGSVFGIVDGAFRFDTEMALDNSILGILGNALCWIFAPLGFGNSTATVATIMGLVAKEEIVGVFGVLDFMDMSKITAYSFLIFNLLCAPCFAAMGAIKREMNSPKWTAFAIGYQCVFAYAISLIVYQFGSAATGNMNIIGFIAALIVLCAIIYLIARKPYNPDKKNKSKTAEKVKITK
ncbi:MAG: ferrous iron transporter B [Clostridia bacterium]|nr:ferrous iron transporter B [Clostridia bacterium]MBR3974500.1 ferrous iron transporter B [Clostridia bacterium]